MTTSRQRVSWNRLMLEGFVIVISILLAFAIDAWWDQQRQTRDAEDQVDRVIAELKANLAILQIQDEALEYATEAAREFLSIMGPETGSVSVDTIGLMMVNHIKNDSTLQNQLGAVFASGPTINLQAKFHWEMKSIRDKVESALKQHNFADNCSVLSGKRELQKAQDLLIRIMKSKLAEHLGLVTKGKCKGSSPSDAVVICWPDP